MIYLNICKGNIYVSCRIRTNTKRSCWSGYNMYNVNSRLRLNCFLFVMFVKCLKSVVEISFCLILFCVSDWMEFYILSAPSEWFPSKPSCIVHRTGGTIRVLYIWVQMLSITKWSIYCIWILYSLQNTILNLFICKQCDTNNTK